MKAADHALINPFKLILGFVGYGTYFLAAAGFVVVGLPFFLLLAPWPVFMRRTAHAVLKAYSFFLTRLWLPALGVYRLSSIAGLDSARLRGSIVVANHRSRLDALLLLSMLPPAVVIIKRKYTRIPLYSSFVTFMDFIAIDSDSLSSLGAAYGKCRRALEQGKCLLVFPEGTRAATGRMLPFKPFPFRLAAEGGVSVVPVAIHSSLPFMARCRGSIFPKRTFDYKIRFLPPHRVEDGENAAGFAERVRREMAKELAELDRGTFWDTEKPDR